MTAPHRHSGLTLVELMVALALFSVLGLLTWRATGQMIDTSARVTTELGRWRDISRAMQHIELALLQVAAPALPAGSDAPPALQLIHSADGPGTELRLLVLGAEGEGPRLQAFRFGTDRVEWVSWPGRNALGAAEHYPLLDRVGALRWRFVGSNGTSEEWPLPGQIGNILPVAVEMQLDLNDAGTLTRLFALR